MSARPVTTLPESRLRELAQDHDRLRRQLASDTNRGDRRGASLAARRACEVARLLDEAWRTQLSAIDFAYLPLYFEGDPTATLEIVPSVLADAANASVRRIALLASAEAELAVGSPLAAVRRMDEAVREVETSDDAKTLGECLHTRGNAKLAAGDAAGAEADYAAAERSALTADPAAVARQHFAGDATLASARLRFNALDARGSLGLAIAVLGRLDEGARIVDDVLAEAAALVPPPVQLVLENRVRLAAIALRQGRRDVELGKDLREVAARSGHRRWYRELLVLEALAAESRGDTAEAAARRAELERLDALLGPESARRLAALGPTRFLTS